MHHAKFGRSKWYHSTICEEIKDVTHEKGILSGLDMEQIELGMFTSQTSYIYYSRLNNNDLIHRILHLPSFSCDIY